MMFAILLLIVLSIFYQAIYKQHTITLMKHLIEQAKTSI